MRAIIADVRRRGDAAVLAYSRRFDRVKATLGCGAGSFQRTNCCVRLEKNFQDRSNALRAAAMRIRRFHRAPAFPFLGSTRRPTARGSGKAVTPLERVGIYVPGGKAAYPSSVLMNAIPAKVAGVREVVMVSPNPNPLVLAAAAIAGVDRVIVIGGAQAIAALAYGTRSVPRWTRSSARATPTWPKPSARCSARSAST